MGGGAGEGEWLRGTEGHAVGGSVRVVYSGSLLAGEVGSISGEGRVVQ